MCIPTEKMKTPETEDDEVEELPLFCKEQHVCWNAVESQYCAADKTPTRARGVQTETVCCHCYSDRKSSDNKKMMRDNETGAGGLIFLSVRLVLMMGQTCRQKKGTEKNQARGGKGKEEKKSAKRASVRTTR